MLCGLLHGLWIAILFSGDDQRPCYMVRSIMANLLSSRRRARAVAEECMLKIDGISGEDTGKTLMLAKTQVTYEHVMSCCCCWTVARCRLVDLQDAGIAGANYP
jgi:hypothetical protein